MVILLIGVCLEKICRSSKNCRIGVVIGIIKIQRAKIMLTAGKRRWASREPANKSLSYFR
jgi:hypothetical protein